MAFVALESRETEPLRLADELDEPHDIRSGVDAGALLADVHVDEDRDLDSARAGAPPEFACDLGVVDGRGDLRLRRERYEAVHVAGDGFTCDEDVGDAVRDHDLGLANFRGADADRSKSELLLRDDRALVRLVVRAERLAAIA